MKKWSRKFSFRMALIFLLSSIVPLLTLGSLMIFSSFQNSRNYIIQRNAEAVKTFAKQIELYLTQELQLLTALTQNIEKIGLNAWQKETILKNYVNRFPAILSLTLTDTQGKVIASSEFDQPTQV